MFNARTNNLFASPMPQPGLCADVRATSLSFIISIISIIRLA